MKSEGMPCPRNDWSPARPKRVPANPSPVSSRMTPAARPRASAIACASVSTVAFLPPVESTLRCSTQLSLRSSQKLSAYQVEPEYRPWEWPDQKARRRPRRKASRCGSSTRSVSSIRALALPLSMAP
jgi:hypothetical protein